MSDIMTHDERQLRRMLDCIDATRNNRMSLQAASDSLLFLRDALENLQADWARDFTSHLATLESAGLASPEQIGGMGEGYPRLIAETLDALDVLVRARLQALASGVTHDPERS